MTTLTITVRIVPCDDCKGSGKITGTVDGKPIEPIACRRCDERGEVVATSERMLVGLVLAWDKWR